MVAIPNDILFASEPGKRPQIAKLAEQHNSGAASFVMESLDGWADQCSFVVYEVDTDGNPILGSETDWIGVRSGRTIQNAAKTSGIDRDYPASRTYAIATETAGARNRLIRALFNTIDENGHLKHEIIDYSHIKNKSITKEKLVDRCVVSEKLGLKSVGSAELKDGAVKANNIDWATIPTYKYSTSERVIGEWVDGKTIYRRVWVFSGVGDINLGVRIHNIIHQSMIVRSNEDWCLRPVPWLYGAGAGVDGDWHAGFYVTAPNSGNSYCRMQFGSRIGKVAGGHLILEYTKP